MWTFWFLNSTLSLKVPVGRGQSHQSFVSYMFTLLGSWFAPKTHANTRTQTLGTHMLTVVVIIMRADVLPRNFVSPIIYEWTLNDTIRDKIRREWQRKLEGGNWREKHWLGRKLHFLQLRRFIFWTPTTPWSFDWPLLVRLRQLVLRREDIRSTWSNIERKQLVIKMYDCLNQIQTLTKQNKKFHEFIRSYLSIRFEIVNIGIICLEYILTNKKRRSTAKMVSFGTHCLLKVVGLFQLRQYTLANYPKLGNAHARTDNVPPLPVKFAAKFHPPPWWYTLHCINTQEWERAHKSQPSIHPTLMC